MELLDAYNRLLEKRFSPRGFSGKQIDENKLRHILEAARKAPSSFNEQPWRFVYALKHKEEHFQNLLSCLNEKNQGWAKDAPVLMLAVAKNTFSVNGRPNRHAWYDTGAAISMMTLKATALDIYVHQMAGFDPAKAREVLQIPEGYDAVAVVALGYLDGQEKKDKPRRTLEEIAFEGKWAE